MKKFTFAGLAAGAAVMALTALPASSQTINLKLAHFVTPKHSMSQWLEKWAAELNTKTGGKVKITIIPGSQMGPPPKYYDIVRRGQADMAWFAHGFTPGRFPLTEISNLPFLIGSAEIGTKVLNDATLRAKYLDKEHRGVKVLMLFTHQPGNIHTAKKAVRTVDDLKGMRIRFASATIREYILALGGTPVGMPPTQIVPTMQKGTLDGAFIDYGGAGIGFRLGPVTKYTTEMYSYVTSFGLAINENVYKRLPADVRKVMDESLVGREAEVGHEWDKLDAIGKAIMVKAGDTPIILTAAEKAKFREIGAKVTAARLERLEKRGLPAKAVFKMMQDLVAKHAPNSKNFLQ